VAINERKNRYKECAMPKYTVVELLYAVNHGAVYGTEMLAFDADTVQEALERAYEFTTERVRDLQHSTFCVIDSEKQTDVGTFTINDEEEE
jgi:hypothetical protein